MSSTPTPITPAPVTRGFNHVATLTTDCDRHAAFYAKAFGATVSFRMEAREDHPRMFILDLGGGAVGGHDVAICEGGILEVVSKRVVRHGE